LETLMSRRSRKAKRAGADMVRAGATQAGATATAVVDDPYEAGARTAVVVSLRDDPLRRLRARNQIDEAQFQAGRHWQRLCEEAEIGSIRAVDTTREPVDGGSQRELLTDRQRRAAQGLMRAARALGREGDELVRDVLGRRLFIEQAAALRGATTQRSIDYVGRRLRECLETLASEFGYA
jgi:hypothetical protein